MHRVVDQPLVERFRLVVAQQAGAAKEPRSRSAWRGHGGLPKIGAVVTSQAEIDLQIAALLFL
jgi:hypothetical protein